jgi:hypothetical protein
MAIAHGGALTDEDRITGFRHDWLTGVLIAGGATTSQLRAFGVSMAGLYDQLPRLFGPPIMTGPDYKIRRLIADQLLSTVQLPTGETVRIGEGGHAALAAALARALGASDEEVEGAATRPGLVARADQLVATMFEPPAWTSMAAVARAEADFAPRLRALGDVLRTAYHVAPVDLGLFEAPPIYAAALIEGAEDHAGTAFDQALYSYYRSRIGAEWVACWSYCLDEAAAA